MIQIAINILVLSCVYTLLAKSFELIYHTVSLFLLTHALAITLGPYLLYSLLRVMFPLGPSIVVVLFGIVLFMVVLCRLMFLPLVKKRVKNWEIMIVSLGIYYVFINFIPMLWGDEILPMKIQGTMTVHSWHNVYINNLQIVTIFISISLIVLLFFLTEKTSFGKKIKASSVNFQLCVLYGNNPIQIVSLCIAVGSGLAVIAGLLIALDLDIKPSMGFDWLMYGIVAMIIGGIGKMRYMVFGALLLATAQHLSAYFFDSKWMNATAYIILVIFLYFRPFGFSGKKLKKTEV